MSSNFRRSTQVTNGAPPKKGRGQTIGIVILGLSTLAAVATIFTYVGWTPCTMVGKFCNPPILKSTPTPRPMPTPTLAPTATPTPSVTAPLGLPKGWSLKLQDSLQAQDSNQWDTGPLDTGTNRQFAQGGYLLSTPTDDGVDGLAEDGPQFTDFYAEVTVAIQTGAQDDTGDAGLELRVDGAGDSYIYSFDADGNWYFYLNPANANNPTELAHGVSTALMTGEGKQNLLGVKVQGQTFTLYANNQQIGTVTDNTYTKGLIGLEANGGDQAPASALFTNLRVWTP